MNDQFRNFFNALKGTDVGTKVVIAMSSVAMVAAIAVVGMVSNETHFEVVWSDLTETEAGRVSTALANKGIEFRQQHSNSKVVIVVASNEVSSAHQAAAEEGAIIGMEKGIFAASSSGGVFDGAGERNQKLKAARWSQTEKMLESLEFITEALIQTSLDDGSSSRTSRPTSGSVTIRTNGGIALTKEEGQRVANTVIHALSIDPKLLTIMDTNGRSVYSPLDEKDAAGSIAANFQREYDLALAAKVHESMTRRYGPNMVDVVVTSAFDFTQSTTTKHEPLKGVKTSERTLTTSTPAGSSGSVSGAGGVAGTASNTPNGLDDWADNDAVVTGGGGGGAQNSTTDESESKSSVGYQDSFQTSTQPTLTQLSISVGIDSSLAEYKEDIDANVKAMVGYDDDRGDNYSSSASSAFYVPEIPEGSEELTPVMSEEGVDTNFLIEKGVEIVSALAFIILLLKGMKSAKGSAAVGATTMNAAGGTVTIAPDGTAVPDTEIAPEQLARAQVDDLVKNNPERVAQILSNWVVEDRNAVNS